MSEEIKELVEESQEPVVETINETKEKDQRVESTLDEVISEIKSVDEPEVIEKPKKEVTKKRRGRPKKSEDVKKSTKDTKSDTLMLTNPTPFYAAVNQKAPKAKISGAVTVLSRSNGWLHVIATVSGYGRVQGYIRDIK